MAHGLTLGLNFYLLLAIELISTPVVTKFRATIKKFRSNCPEMFSKNLEKFTGKHLYRSLFFNKISELKLATMFKKRL